MSPQVLCKLELTCPHLQSDTAPKRVKKKRRKEGRMAGQGRGKASVDGCGSCQDCKSWDLLESSLPVVSQSSIGPGTSSARLWFLGVVRSPTLPASAVGTVPPQHWAGTGPGCTAPALVLSFCLLPLAGAPPLPADSSHFTKGELPSPHALPAKPGWVPPNLPQGSGCSPLFLVAAWPYSAPLASVKKVDKKLFSDPQGPHRVPYPK